MDRYEKMTDEQLIQKLRDGDNRIVDYIMEKYKNLVRKEANAMYLLGGENEDLIQEGMIGLFKAVKNYDDEKNASFSTFASLCVKRQIYTTVTASKRKKHGPLNNYISLFNEQGEEDQFMEEDTNPEQVLIQKENISDYYKKIETKLSSFEKDVMELYLSGENYVEIAVKLDKPKKSIDNAIQRIRRKLGEES